MESGFLETALKMSMALGAVLIVFAGCVFAFKKFSNMNGFMAKKGRKFNERPIEIISHQSLGPARSLYLIQCGGKKILIGATNQSIQLVSQISELGLDDDVDFASSLSEHAGSSDLRKDMGRNLKDIARV